MLPYFPLFSFMLPIFDIAGTYLLARPGEKNCPADSMILLDANECKRACNSIGIFIYGKNFTQGTPCTKDKNGACSQDFEDDPQVSLVCGVTMGTVNNDFSYKFS